jgi:hypothetical protein
VKIKQAGFQGVQAKVPVVANADDFGDAGAVPTPKGNKAFLPLLHHQLADIFSNSAGAAGVYCGIDLKSYQLLQIIDQKLCNTFL